jgi:cell division protein FtsL
LINLDNKTTIIIVGIIFISLLGLYLPKIYIKNNIYYTSRNINKLYSHYISLKEENRALSAQLEDMKFKNQILDTIILQYKMNEGK